MLIDALDFERALEDAAILGALLNQINSVLQVAHVTEIYETMRKERIGEIRQETFRQREEFHLPDGPSQEYRDSQLALSFDDSKRNTW